MNARIEAMVDGWRGMNGCRLRMKTSVADNIRKISMAVARVEEAVKDCRVSLVRDNEDAVTVRTSPSMEPKPTSATR